MLIIAAPFLGSFVACLAQRLPLKRPIATGRSHCDRCAVALGPLELVPIVSWIALKGKCRHCLGSISSDHVVAEVVAAALAIWAVVVVPGWLVWPTALLGWTLLALALMDFHHFVLADVLVLPLLVAGIGVSFVLSEAQGIASIAGAAIGGGVAFAIREIYSRVRGRIGLGLGDVKLLAAAGAWVSWQGLPSVLLIASVTALIVWLALFAMKSGTQFHLSATARVPFGIFLALGLWIVWLHGPIQFGVG
jgi:leader peptidase (prepilin peptidase)/N-methyltransferase